MLLSVSELEVRKLKFAQTYQPGEIDFSGEDVKQSAPLVTEGVAELLPHTGGEIRVTGKVVTSLETECDRCLGRATFPIDAPFDLFYRPRRWQESKKNTPSTKARPKWDFTNCPASSWKIS